MFYTTLNRIRSCIPCTYGWKKLLKALNKTEADDEPLSLLAILDSNGLDDALWALQAIDDCPEIRLFAVRCVRQVQHLIKNTSYLDALDIAELYAIGEATDAELREAEVAAEEVARDATWRVVWNAAWAAAWTAARAAARAAREAEDAARAAEDAAGVEEAVGYVERETQKQDFVAIFCS